MSQSHDLLPQLPADGWRLRTYPAGAVLWRQGEEADSLALIEEGALRIEREGAEPLVLGPGQTVGELGVLGHEGWRSADVVAQVDTRLWVLSLTALQALRAARAPGWQRVLSLVMPQLARRVDRTRSRLLPGSTVPILDPADTPLPALLSTAAQALQAVPDLAGLPEPTRMVLARDLELQRVGPGVPLTTQDGHASALVVLASGKASIEVDGVEVGEFDAGTLLGADALMQPRSWRSTVRTSTPSQVLVLDQAAWTALPDAARLDLSEALFEVLRRELLAANAAG